MKIEKHRYNACLADYFLVQPLFFDGDKQKNPNVRKCVEQPWQQTMSHSEDIVNTLNNFDFIDAKLSIKLHKSLLNDFEIIHGKYEILDNNYKLILSNLLNLVKYPTQFINLLYHIGEERIKKQVKETIRERPNKQTFLLSEKEDYQKLVAKESSDYQGFIILNRKEFATSKVTFASHKELLYGIKQIGNLTAIDINNGDEFFVKIDLLPDIPENIYISDSGNYFLIAYSNGIAFIYQFIYIQQGSNLFIEAEKIAPEIRFKLPEFDPPVFCFKGESLIYQNQGGEIVEVDLIKNVNKKINLGSLPYNEIELATINFNSEYGVFGVRRFRNSQIFVTSHNEIIGSYKFDDVIQCSAFLNENELIVCTLDKKLFRFKLSTKGLTKELIIKLPEAPIDCISGQNSVIALLRPNHFFVYQPQKNLKHIEGIPNDIGILRTINYIEKNTFLIGTTNQFIKFSLEDKTGYKPFEIITINTRKDGSYLVLLNESTRKILYDSETKSLKTFDEIKSSYINETFLSIDAEYNILHLFLEGFGYLLKNKKKEWIKIENIPTDSASLTGDSESGFWLSTKSGQIIFIDANGKLEVRQTISEEIINTGIIRVFKNMLVWNGIVLKSGEYGTDFKCQIRFYKIKRELFHTTLLTIRERIFADHNSLVDSICFNELTDSFYIFLFSDKSNVTQAVRIGTVDDFGLKKEMVVPIEGLNQSVKYSNLEYPNEQCFIIGNQNGLFLIDMKLYKVISTLQPNIGLNKITIGHSASELTLITDTNNQIYKINIVKGGK